MKTHDPLIAKSHFVGLDGMRGLAAICVVIFHWFAAHQLQWFGTSVLAVDFFFVLSGFVIAYSYSTKLNEGLKLATFMLLRVIRLYPMILLGLCLGLVRSIGKAFTGEDGVTLGQVFLEFIFSVFLVPNQLIGSVEFYQLNVPLWSLLFEMMAYFFFGLFLWRAKGKALFIACAVFFLGFLYYMSRSFSIGEIIIEPNMVIGDITIPIDHAITPAARVAFGFTLGILLHDRSLDWNVKLPSFKFLALCFCIFMFLPRTLAPFYVYAAIFVTLTIALIVKGTRSQIDGRMKATFRFLGDISFPLYAIHMPIIGVMGFVTKRLLSSSQIDPVYFGILIVPLTVFLSYLAFRVIDVPTRQWLTKYVKNKGWVSIR
jgi:peptidoglycan/LPS O-acetylase OafA/YrhL